MRRRHLPAADVGACCVPASATNGARCFVGTAASCATAAGTYGGNGSTCRSANCATACACDWDHDGVLTQADLFTFLNDWAAGTADFNNDSATNQSDLTDFIACFRNPPTGCARLRQGPSGGPRP